MAFPPVEDGGGPLPDGLLGVAEAVDGGREDGVDVRPEGDAQPLDQQPAHIQAVLGDLEESEKWNTHQIEPIQYFYGDTIYLQRDTWSV